MPNRQNQSSRSTNDSAGDRLRSPSSQDNRSSVTAVANQATSERSARRRVVPLTQTEAADAFRQSESRRTRQPSRSSRTRRAIPRAARPAPVQQISLDLNLPQPLHIPKRWVTLAQGQRRLLPVLPNPLQRTLTRVNRRLRRKQ